MAAVKEKGNISIHTENIFPIIKKFLYSDHEIFLRELVSNAVDATQKLERLASIGEFKGELGDLKVKVSVNKKAKTITISDNGIGMTAEEIKKYINQIAFSGAADFVEKFKDKVDKNQIIGMFGLGFYSAFMVAKKVDIITKSYQEGEEAAELGLVTIAYENFDWDDELRVMIEERVSFSPDALTGMESNLRFAGPETLETKIFGRLSAWQNWIFQRPNAAGDFGGHGAAGSDSAVSAFAVPDAAFAETIRVSFVQTNDIARGLQTLIDDMSGYYLLGYYSGNDKPDGRYRTIAEAKARLGLGELDVPHVVRARLERRR